MAKSIKQIEAEVLAFLDTIGEDSAAFRDVSSMKGMEKAIILSAANFILRVQENLNKAGKIDTGGLSTEITQGELISTGTGYEIEVGYPKGSKAAKYYDYVNKGVRGFIDESSAPNSPYKYKSEYPKYGGVMHKAIMGWYRRNAGAGRLETQKKGLSAVQRKRKKLSKMVDANQRLRSLAYATAINIKRRGLKRTGFFDKAVDESFGSQFYSAIAKITGKEIGIQIRSYGDNNK
jgi:hypothetical protein